MTGLFYFSKKGAAAIREKCGRYELFPIALREAREFVEQYHRHNAAPHAHKFSIGIKEDGRLVGVVVVGRPISRHLDDGRTAEITRCCVMEGKTNANSMLYGAACRAAMAMGYRKAVTYTLPSESGSSLLAAGFHIAAATKPSPHGWDVPSRPRKKAGKYPAGEKLRWERRL